MSYAKQYYTKSSLKHLVIWPYVTSRIFYSVLSEVTNRQNNILALVREGHGDHKGTDVVLSCLIPKFKDFKFTFLSGTPLSEPYKSTIQEKARNAGVSISFHESLSEIDKWRLYKSCSHLLYLSTFEGFGLPPVEALVAGCQPICFKLPVLEEFSGNKISFISSREDVHNEIYDIVSANTKGIEFDYEYNSRASLTRCSEQFQNLLQITKNNSNHTPISQARPDEKLLYNDEDMHKLSAEIAFAFQNKRLIIRGPDILSKTGGYSSCMRDIFTCLINLDLEIYFQPSQI